MGKPKAPNFRRAICCDNCKHSYSYGPNCRETECRKYSIKEVYCDYVCDDWEGDKK